MTTPRRILVPIDLGDHATEVLDHAAALARLAEQVARTARCPVLLVRGGNTAAI
jgi:nucleotide-binding universal stress UspA family protein